MSETGILYLVPTPIGNLGDISHRAIETLEKVDLIACEDTRHSGKLLAHFDITNRKISYFEHNESSRAGKIIEVLERGESVAVISDGGSPGLSDPAFRVVRAAIEHGIRVEALPGSTALVPALTASGLPTDRFFFEGFLPVKSGKRKTRLEKLKDFPHTVIYYESVHRIKGTMKMIADIYGDRPVVVARELTKIYEEYIRGTALEVAEKFETVKAKGEFVILIGGCHDAD